jgi:hypothetical protein
MPAGYEEIGEDMPLSMLPGNLWMVEAYDQRAGTYGVLLHDVHGKSVKFLSSLAELDGLCAAIEWCIDLCAYLPISSDVIEEWRSVWWMTQAVMTQQRLREAQA